MTNSTPKPKASRASTPKAPPPSPKTTTSKPSARNTSPTPKATRAKTTNASKVAPSKTPTKSKAVVVRPSFGEQMKRGLQQLQRLRKTSLPSWVDEVGAILLIILGGIILAALLGSAEEETFSAMLAKGLRQMFGVGAFLVALIAMFIGLVLLLPKFRISLSFSVKQIIALEVVFVCLQALFHLFAFEEEGRGLARAGEGGGYVGWAVSSLVSSIFGTWFAIFVFVGGFIYSGFLFFQIKRHHLREALEWVSIQAQDFATQLRPAPRSKTVSVGVSSAATSQAALVPPTPSAEFIPEPKPIPAPPLSVNATTAEVYYEPLPDMPTRSGSAVKPASPPVLPTIPGPRPSVTAAIRQQSVEKTSIAPSATPVSQTAPMSTVPKTTATAVKPPPAAIEHREVIDPVVPPVIVREVTPPRSTYAAKPPRDYVEDNETMATGDHEEERNTVTMTINGRVINAATPTVEETSRNRKTRTVGGRRYFVVDGYQDKVKVGKRPEILPSFELLEYSELKLPTEEEINTNAHIIENTMLEFDVDADVIDVKIGPTVTQYAVSPIKEVINENGEKVIIRTRVGKIASLADDLALALSAKRLRIEAPVPGFSYVGIEVPNREPSVVSLRSVLESEQFYKDRKRPLSIPLGRDVSGEPVVTDLATMPHLLIAGTTGSGKSVCLTSVVTSLIMNNTPDTMQLILLDPKMVELTQFNGLPHLIGPVETDIDRIIGVLRWTAREMDRRYKLLEIESARNLEIYNQILGKKRKNEYLPYIVLVIDEIGDLMMSRPDETEKTLTRLAQKARAAGIHLVVATQRPSVDVVTGLIKANFPARISFAVASGVDSRVILDSVGAETLMGKGDMLFLAADAGAPVRLQGCYVSDDELGRVVMHWRHWYAEQIAQGNLEPLTSPPWERGMTRLEALSELDPILEEALKLVVAEGNASTSLLQRRLSVSYPRAARLMDSLYELGIIGAPQAGGRTREVLVKSVDKARQMIINNRTHKPTDMS